MKSKPLSYTALIKHAPHLLIFGFLMTFCSSLGQTFFIGAFGPSIQNEFKLSHSEWGSIYMIGTTDRQIQVKKLYIFCFLGPLRIWTIYFNCTNRLVANTGDILPQAIGPRFNQSYCCNNDGETFFN